MENFQDRQGTLKLLHLSNYVYTLNQKEKSSTIPRLSGAEFNCKGHDGMKT